MNALKTVGKFLQKFKGEVCVADFALFGLLGSFVDKELKKMAKGQKDIKKRWNVVSKDQKFKELFQRSYNNIF